MTICKYIKVEKSATKELHSEVEIRRSSEGDICYASEISQLIKEDASKSNSGLCRRSVAYLSDKLASSKAVISFVNGQLAGFCYIESWGHGNFVANSGLIIKPRYRGMGLAREMKKMIFSISRETYPTAKFFGLTTNLGVMKINSELGYEPVTFSELTDDPEYWKECVGCLNYSILQASNYKNCLCTAFLFDPEKKDSHYFKQKFLKKFALSKQEFLVFQQIIQGYQSSQIAEKLFISMDTVSSHRKRIIKKTGSKTPLEMYLLAKNFKLDKL